MPHDSPNLEFRSPDLSKPKDWRQLPLVLRRFVAVGLAAAAILLVVVLVVGRLAPLRGWGYPLYWLHDYAWLPFVGYTWTLFYPFSLSWWTLGICAAALWILTYLTRWSIVRRPHAWLCRVAVALAVRSELLSGMLIAVVDFFGRRRFGPDLLAEVVRLEWNTWTRCSP